MIDEKTLSKMSVKELREMADEKKLVYTSKTKKADLVKMILTDEKTAETVKEKKEELTGKAASSQVSSASVVKENVRKGNEYFNNMPDIPAHYGKNKLIFMVRDPYWGYVYWEVNSTIKNEHSLTQLDTYLRVYDVTETDSPESNSGYFDIRLTKEAESWYIKFQRSNRTYIVDYGYFKDGKFVTVMRSNKAATPRDDVSDQIDVEWMTNDTQFADILRASGVGRLFERIGSQEMVKFIANNLEEENSISSGGTGLTVTSGGIAASGKKVRV